MASRRDQLLSHQFQVGRSVSALLTHDTDPVRPPMRGAAGAGFAGVIVAAIVILGVLVYGMVVRGGKTSWRTDDAMVVERETGTRFVFRAGVLYPVANQTTALLLGATSTVEASRASLAGTPRGAPIGILGAPESPPPPSALTDGAWLFCVAASRDDTGVWRTTSVLSVGTGPTDGQPLGDGGLLVRPSLEAGTWLVWHGRRYEIRDPDVVLTALAWRAVEPTLVDSAWLNAIPTAAAIARVTHAGFGTPSAFAHVTSGRVFFVQTGGARQYYVALPDGLAPITPLQADILRGDRDVNADQQPAQEIQASAVVLSGSTLLPADADAVPDSAPVLATPEPTTRTCASFAGGAAVPDLLLVPTATAPPAVARTAGTGLAGVQLADYVVVPPAGGALVAAGPEDGTILLVSEPGIAYPVPPVALPALGYADVAPVRLPSSLVARVPVGPALDPAAAALPISR